MVARPRQPALPRTAMTCPAAHEPPPEMPSNASLPRQHGPALADGPAREALRRALARLDEAERSQSPSALCQALAESARALAGLQAYAAAEQHLAQALRWALVMGATDLRADLACAAAELAADAADLARARTVDPGDVRRARDRARDQAFEAARLAGQTADPHWEIKLLLRASDVLDRCGDHDDAVQMQHRALVLMGLHDPDLDPEAGAAPADGPRDPLQLSAPGRLM